MRTTHKVVALYKLLDCLVKTVYIIPGKVNKTAECKSKTIRGKKRQRCFETEAHRDRMRRERKKNEAIGHRGFRKLLYICGGGGVLFPSFILPPHRSTAEGCHSDRSGDLLAFG